MKTNGISNWNCRMGNLGRQNIITQIGIWPNSSVHITIRYLKSNIQLRWAWLNSWSLSQGGFPFNLLSSDCPFGLCGFQLKFQIWQWCRLIWEASYLVEDSPSLTVCFPLWTQVGVYNRQAHTKKYLLRLLSQNLTSNLLSDQPWIWILLILS